jgi:hypothetical protein
VGECFAAANREHVLRATGKLANKPAARRILHHNLALHQMNIALTSFDQHLLTEFNECRVCIGVDAFMMQSNRSIIPFSI